jgi:hypothetical protein
MRVDPVGAESLNGDCWPSRHDEANSHLLHLANACRNCWFGIGEGVTQRWDLILLKIRLFLYLQTT